MIKITAELIQQSNQFINPLKERQLDLKGSKIAVIENLGATLDFFECIDLSDNEITKLGNFTILRRLKSLILCNNHISRILQIGDSLINLENLILTNNKISSLAEVDNLASCKKLLRLVLLNNQITQIKNYRLHVIARIPSLKMLDFQKVKVKEREEAVKYLEGFKVTPENTKLDKKAKLKNLIENARSLEEINRLELLLKTEEVSEYVFDQKLKEITKK